MHHFPPVSAHFFIQGPAGQLELMTTYPHERIPEAVAVICHPHPLYEGTMHNKVVTTLAKTFEALGLATLRFNFRGVGKSAGHSSGKFAEQNELRNYDCEGELDDLRAVLDWVEQALPGVNLCLAGFSFGSYIAAKIAEERNPKFLISIAPPVERMPFYELKNIVCPWWVVQGEDDELVSPQAVYQWAQQPPSPLSLIAMPGVGHYFHGKLGDLREILLAELKQAAI